MKFVLSSDWHPDHSTHGVPRFDEIRDAAFESVRTAIEEKAHAYVFAGDLCDPDSGSVVLRCVRLAIEVARTLSERGIPSIWIAGNHDVLVDGSGESSLSPLRGLLDPNVRVFERPGSTVIRGERVESDEWREVTFFPLPYTAPSHAYDVEAAVADIDVEHSDLPKKDRVIVAHLNIPGVVPGEETNDMPRGREVVLPAAAILHAGMVLCGHYHRRQITKEGVIIPGSLAALTFGEQANEPAFLVLEV